MAGWLTEWVILISTNLHTSSTLPQNNLDGDDKCRSDRQGDKLGRITSLIPSIDAEYYYYWRGYHRNKSKSVSKYVSEWVSEFSHAVYLVHTLLKPKSRSFSFSVVAASPSQLKLASGTHQMWWSETVLCNNIWWEICNRRRSGTSAKADNLLNKKLPLMFCCNGS